LPTVLENLSHSDPARREAAISAVKAMGSPPQRLLSTLLEFSTNASPALRHQSRVALQLLRLNHPRVAAAQMVGLRDSDPAVRLTSIEALRMSALWTNRSHFSEITAHTLGWDGSLASNLVTELRMLLDDPDAKVRVAAQEALTEIETGVTNEP
jgi:HEAT repeat protein